MPVLSGLSYTSGPRITAPISFGGGKPITINNPGQVQGAKTGPGFNSTAPVGNIGNNVPSSPSPAQAINNQVDAGNSQIEADYQNYLSSLGNQESSLNSQAGNANSVIDTNAAASKTALAQQQATGNQGLDTQANTANKQAASATQQARDLYRQMQTQNQAQLSGLGISSSSVAEALAEKLGVETARRIAGVTGSQQEILQNISKERASLNDYVSGKLTDLQNTVGNQKATIQQQLMDGLNQINQARQVAASDKAARRQDLMINAQNAIANLQSQAQQFAQSLQAYATQGQAKLAQVGQDLPSLLQQLSQASQAASTLPGFQGLSPIPQVAIGANGNYTGSINFTKPKTTDPNDPTNIYNNLVNGAQQ